MQASLELVPIIEANVKIGEKLFRPGKKAAKKFAENYFSFISKKVNLRNCLFCALAEEKRGKTIFATEICGDTIHT
jgi:hypothetical protein